MTDAVQMEQQRLTETLREIGEQEKRLPPKYFGDDFTEQVLDAMREEQRMKFRSLADSPYFGRLDVASESDGASKALYIGKHGMEKKGAKDPWIIDWRAPVAGLFYAFTGGGEEVSYDTPDGPAAAHVHLKRNLAIRQGELQRVTDSYVKGRDEPRVSDEFLLYRLGEQKDNRLKDIVSTIQAEQDKIIRAPRDAAIVIQGVAGSGKTTVALHRLAYLLYRYQEQMKAERMIIFAPNAMFLDYISDVLPELGVGGIRQTTFAEWALERLPEGIRLHSESPRMKRWFAPDANRPAEGGSTAEKIKGSLRCKRWLDRCFRVFLEKQAPTAGLTLWDGCELPAEQVREWYDKEYRRYEPAARRERVIGRIRRWAEMALERLPEWVRKERRPAARQRLNAYVKKWPEPTAVTLYRACYGMPDAKLDFLDASLSREWPEKWRTWMKGRLAKHRYDIGDITALVYLHLKLHGVERTRYDHVIFDEAQDVSPFQVALLQQFMREPSFTILGDLGQAIYAYKGVDDWDEMLALFPEERRSYHELIQSYRSTTEIIEYANRVLAHAGLGIPPARPVFRSGDEVETVALESEAAEREYAAGWIERQGGKRASAAVLGRTDEECRAMHGELAAMGVECALLDAEQDKYKGGVSILPAYLAKGLEFDAVLLVGADSVRYPQDALHAKLLYVGCTRALHHLTICHAGRPSPLLPV